MSIVGIIIILIALGFAMLFIRFAKLNSEYLKASEKRLADSSLYDPSSGTKFTIDQVNEKVKIKNKYKIKSQEELENYYDGSEKGIEEISNYLKESAYLIQELDDNQTLFLDKTILLSNYSSWHINRNSFKFNTNNFIFFPEVTINSNSKYATFFFTGYQIMFWVKISNINGCYFLKPIELSEKITNFFRKKENFTIDGFSIIALKESHNVLLLTSILNQFKNEKNIEIEVNDDNLFIKTNNDPSLMQFTRLLTKIKKVC